MRATSSIFDSLMICWLQTVTTLTPLKQKRVSPSSILADPLGSDMPSIAVILDGETSFGPVEVSNVITF